MRTLDFEFEIRNSKTVSITGKGTIDFQKHLIVGLFGESGAGKSTFLRWLVGLKKAERGHLILTEGPLEQTWVNEKRSVHELPRLRRIGYVAQGSCLFPHLTARENIGYGLHHLDTDLRAKRVDELLRILEIEAVAEQLPPTLSGGQTRRVAIARALAIQPQLLVLDEPFSALDFPTRDRLLPLFKKWIHEFRVPTLFVSHDPRDAEFLDARLYHFDGHHLDCSKDAHAN